MCRNLDHYMTMLWQEHLTGFLHRTPVNISEDRRRRARVRERSIPGVADHPMNRVMAVEERADGLVITATDMHLARAIGVALHRAYEGDLEFAYPEEGAILRVNWSR